MNEKIHEARVIAQAKIARALQQFETVTGAEVIEEGDRCPACDSGSMQFARKEECSCHISPPCWACTNAVLRCDECDWTEPAGEGK